MRQLTLPLAELPVAGNIWKKQALAWASRHFQAVALYEPNSRKYPHGPFQNCLGVRKVAQGTLAEGIAHSWEDISFLKSLFPNLPLFGYLTYDLKNGLENLESRHPDNIGFPELYFFVPEIWIRWTAENIEISSETVDPTWVADQISQTPFLPCFPKNKSKIQARFHKEEYLRAVKSLKQHILEGDVYEVNLCQEFYSEEVSLDPVTLFWELREASPTPFAGFFKYQDLHLICASPERFLKKEGHQLVSQPIKGTIRRGKTPAEDQVNKERLANSEKDRAENMMIVDLVRNDLHRIAQTGSVQVEEMFGLYGFKYVWQMISTITALLPDDTSDVVALQAAFPMGSMTGAPKIKAMELIEKYEKTRRGLYSGSLGYFLPNGDFDFNVVIRSLQYNARSGYLSYQVGSAITFDSDPHEEYQECLLKAEAINKILK